MDLEPHGLILGIFVPPAAPSAKQVTADKINRIWAEVAPLYGYTQLQMSPDHSAANFIGSTPDIGVTIQPPLVQIRDLVNLTPKQSVEKAQAIVKIIGRHLGVEQYFNLGIRYVYQAQLADKDARSFLLNRVLSDGGVGLEELHLGDDTFWGGVKYVAGHPEGEYTVTIEPLRADELKSLYVDVDAQWPGPTTADSVIGRSQDAELYISQSVKRYLGRLLEQGD